MNEVDIIKASQDKNQTSDKHWVTFHTFTDTKIK